MAGGKETPRQKMVGMMYLVLMAMLAINVSKSILDAFITQDEQGLEQNKNIVTSINAIGTKIANLKMDKQSEKTATEIEPIYLEIAKMANKIDDYYLSELNELFKETEQVDKWFTKDKFQVTQYTSLDSMQKKDDYDTPSRLFGGLKGTPSYARGEKLRLELMKYRDELIIIASKTKVKGQILQVEKGDLKSIETLEKKLKDIKHPKTGDILEIYKKLTKPEQVIQHHEKVDWHVARFYHQPMVGVVGTFTSIRNDVRLAQLDASKILLESIDKPMMNINKVEAQVLATTQYLNMGDELKVKVGIVAYDSSKVYAIRYRNGDDGNYTASDSNVLNIRADSPGPKNIQGKLLVEIAGELQERDWSFDYTVGKPSASVALPELNVLYRNYNNVVKAVASGFPPDQVKVSCSGCTSFTPGKEGTYIAKVGGEKTAKVSVTVDGKAIGYQEFRIFSLPNAQPYFVGKSLETKVVDAGLLKQGVKLTAALPNSPLDVQYTVEGFSMSVIQKGKILEVGRTSGSSLSSQMISTIKNLSRGDKVMFEDIKIAAPGGKPAPAGDMNFKVN